MPYPARHHGRLPVDARAFAKRAIGEETVGRDNDRSRVQFLLRGRELGAQPMHVRLPLLYIELAIRSGASFIYLGRERVGLRVILCRIDGKQHGPALTGVLATAETSATQESAPAGGRWSLSEFSS